MPSAQTLGLGIALGCTFLTNANGTFQALQKRARAMLIRGILVFVERKTLLDAVSSTGLYHWNVFARLNLSQGGEINACADFVLELESVRT